MKQKPSLPLVETPDVGGVRLRRHVLDVQASALAHLAKRLRSRLAITLRRLPEDALPDKEWRDNFELYEKTVMDLLKEQRMRAAMPKPGPDAPEAGAPLTPEEEAELAELAREAIDTTATEAPAPDGEPT